jgi:hypothetical protein
MVTFTEYIDILEALATAPGGLTAGQIRRQADINLDTQKITRALKSLEREALVWSSRVAYRPNVHKVVWRICILASAYCSAVKSAYEENEGIRPPEYSDYNVRHELEKVAMAAVVEEAKEDDLPF